MRRRAGLRRSAAVLVLGSRAGAYRLRPRRSSASSRATAARRFRRRRVTGSSATYRSTPPCRLRRRDSERARGRCSMGSCAAAERGSWRDVRAAAPSGLRHSRPRAQERRHERLLLPCGAPRGATRSIDLRLHTSKGAHLCERPGPPAHPRRRDVEHARRRGWADTGRIDSPVALAHRVQEREEAGTEAPGKWSLSAWLTAPTGRERDAARLVHGRVAKRVLDQRHRSPSCVPSASCLATPAAARERN